MTRVKEDITAVSYDLFRRSGLSVKFKVKTHYEGINKQESYYYTTYLYNMNGRKKTSISLSPRSYIQFDFGTDDGKSTFFLSEVYKNRFIRKLNKITALLDAYDNKEIDILKTDDTGTHISNKFPKDVNFTLGIHNVHISVVIREDKMDIGVMIKINDMCAIISMHDFLDLVYKLSGINYTQMTILLLNHIGAPEIGSNEIDFRPSKIISEEDRNKEFNLVASSNNNSLKDLSQNTKSKSYNRIIW